MRLSFGRCGVSETIVGVLYIRCEQARVSSKRTRHRFSVSLFSQSQTVVHKKGKAVPAVVIDRLLYKVGNKQHYDQASRAHQLHCLLKRDRYFRMDCRDICGGDLRDRGTAACGPSQALYRAFNT